VIVTMSRGFVFSTTSSAVMSFVRLAIGRRRCAPFCHSTRPVVRSTTIAARAGTCFGWPAGAPATSSTFGVPPGPPPDHDLGFPLVVKPHRSRVATAKGWKSCDVTFANDAGALAQELSRRGAHEFPIILQERIVGPGLGVFAHYHRGRLVTLFSHRRIRERPPWGGLSVLSESVPLDPEARDAAVALLDDLQWHGVAMVEFKRDDRDGRAKLMEINGRFWGSLQLAIDAGVDFPQLLLQGIESGEFAPRPPYRVGVRNRWLWP